MLPAGPPAAPLPYGPSSAPDAAPSGWAASSPTAATPVWSAPDPGSRPPAPPGWTPALPVYGANPPPPPNAPVTKGRSRAALAILSVTAVLAASTFAFVALTRPDGSASAEEAVEKLFESIEQEDAVGVMESLPPGEREVLLDPMVAAVGELQRLGLLDSFQLEDVPGADIEVEGLTLQSTNLGPGVTKVRVTGGTITGTVIPDEVPIGPKTRELAEKEGESIDIEADSSTESLAESDLELVAIEEDGGWHVSLFYSIAESARGDDQPLPQFGSGAIAPIGADTPEGAVRGLVEAGLALDLGRAVGHLPPDEMRVLYDYVPLVLDDADEAADEARADGFTASLDRLDLHAEGDGETRRVTIDGLDVRAGVEEDSLVHYSWDGSCTVMEVTEPKHRARFAPIDPETGQLDEPEPPSDETSTMRMEACTDGRLTITEDGEEVDEDVYGPFGSGSMSSGPFGSVSPFGTGTDLGQTVTVVEHDGRWYVSPVRSAFDSLLTALRGLEGADIDAFFDSFDSMRAPAERFEDVTGPIGGSPGTYPPGTAVLPDPDDPYAICSDQVFGNLGQSTSPEDLEDLDDQFNECLREHGEEPPVATPSFASGPEIVGDHVIVADGDDLVAHRGDGSVAFTGPACENGALAPSTVGNPSTTVVAACGDELVGVDGTDGRELWRTPYDSGTPVQGPSVVLVVDAGDITVLDLATGTERWASSIGLVNHFTLDDTAVYVDDGTETVALDLATGAERWSVGYGLSMLDTVPGGLMARTNDGVVQRLDPATGAVVWTSEPDEAETDEALVVGATAEVVVIASLGGTGTVTAFDLTTGERLWVRERVDEYLGVGAGSTTVVVVDLATSTLLALDHRTGQNAPGAIAADIPARFDVEGNQVAFIGKTADGSYLPQIITVP